MLNTWPHNDFESPSEEVDLSMACRHMLLQAGADPTLGGHARDGEVTRVGQHFHHLLDTGTVVGSPLEDTSPLLKPKKESLRLVLDLGRDFIDLEEKDDCGYNALLRLLWSTRATVEKVDLLLARGANSKACTKDGRSCLHHCITSSEDSDCLEVLKLLIRAGADVHVVDEHGFSVTAYAYDTPEGGWCQRIEPTANGNRGVIWEQALMACGYDAAAIRQAYLDAGGRIPEDSVDSHICSNPQAVLVGSNGVEEPRYFDPEGSPSSTTDYEEQQRSMHDYDWDHHLGAGTNYMVLPSLRDRTLNPRAEVTDLVLPSLQNTLGSIWNLPHTVQEGNFSDTSSTPYSHVPMMEPYPRSANPWTSTRSGQNSYEDRHHAFPSNSDPHDPAPQIANTHWSYNPTHYQSEAPQPDTWLRIQDLDLLEADANVWSQ